MSRAVDKEKQRKWLIGGNKLQHLKTLKKIKEDLTGLVEASRNIGKNNWGARSGRDL
jgi:hypothetical protein